MAMNAVSSFSGEEWQVRIGVWVERQGRAVLGDGRLELLESIDRCRSISAAAREIGVSYRHAWVIVREINQAAGEPLVTACVGGHRGGGATLTPCGKLTVRLCRTLQGDLQRAASGMLPQLLSGQVEEVIHVAAAVSLEEVLAALVTDYNQLQSETRVRIVLGASDELAELLWTGADIDLFLTADSGQLDTLTKQKIVRAETVTLLAENTLAAIGSPDLAALVKRPVDLVGRGVARVALAAPCCPLGSYTRAYLMKMGLYEAVRERALLVDHSRAVAAAVQAGQADAGLVYASATLTVPDCRVLFRVRRMPQPIHYAGAVVSRSRRPEQAHRFLNFLTSAQAARRFVRCGFRCVRPDRGRMGTEHSVAQRR
jgi:molybdenum ABC transporter molybdate-binding protein